jgi:hypothetical protein
MIRNTKVGEYFSWQRAKILSSRYQAHTMILTAEQILALAPDPASAKAGSGQANPAHWTGLGAHEQALWGLCQGSEKDPYRTQIDFSGPAFKCTCPSRKFPCKHGLGLYLLYAKQHASFTAKDAPPWVSDWLHSREQRSEKKAAEQADATPEQLAAKAQGAQKRQDKRMSNVAQGIAILDTWLADLAREGLAGLKSKPAATWEAMAARMVDAQASGLAARIRRAGMYIYGSSEGGWEIEVARELSQLALLSLCHQRIEQLPEALQQDIRGAISLVHMQEEAQAQAPLVDVWQVCGNNTQHDERISRRACYLRGQRSGRWAMLLQFAAGAQTLPSPLLPGTCYGGSLHFYPSATPLRAAFGSDMKLIAAPNDIGSGLVSDSFSAMLTDYAQRLAANPLLEHHPALLQVTPHYVAEPAPRWLVRQDNGDALEIDGSFRHPWLMHALAGGLPSKVFGLWNGRTLLPLALVTAQSFHSFDIESAR